MVLGFFRAYGLKTMRIKLMLLYALNVYDALMTYLLLQTGYFVEINLLLSKSASNIGKMFFLKALLPALLIACLYVRIQKATEKQLKSGNIAVSSVLLLYIFVDALHLIWAICFLAYAFGTSGPLPDFAGHIPVENFRINAP